MCLQELVAVIISVFIVALRRSANRDLVRIANMLGAMEHGWRPVQEILSLIRINRPEDSAVAAAAG
jgi:hypothetical protein